MLLIVNIGYDFTHFEYWTCFIHSEFLTMSVFTRAKSCGIKLFLTHARDSQGQKLWRA